MRHLVAVLVVLVVVALSACAPTLGGDGFYRCSREGRCPSSAPYCHPDGFCRVGPAALGDAGADAEVDAGAPDLGWADPYADCIDSCTAADEVCYSLSIPTIGTAGYCTRACTTDAECPAYRGAPSACGPAGKCVRGCAGPSDCPDPFECISGRWAADGSLSTACGGQELYAPFSEYDACATTDSCERPLECVDGRCLRHCGDASPRCSELEFCGSSPSASAVCLFACDLDATACNSTFQTACDGRVCQPASW